MSANKANIIAVMGASGSGKSTFVKRSLKKTTPRLLIWDALDEYGGFGAEIDTLGGLLDVMAAKRFKAVFRPSADQSVRDKQFDLLCRAAMAAGNLTLVVEELRFVTKPSRAPLGWAQVCLTGRHVGLTVYGTSQRPASIDKDFLGNATVIRTGLLPYPEDEKAVAKAMKIDPAEIAALRPLEWIERNKSTGTLTKGRLIF